MVERPQLRLMRVLRLHLILDLMVAVPLHTALPLMVRMLSPALKPMTVQIFLLM